MYSYFFCIIVETNIYFVNIFQFNTSNQTNNAYLDKPAENK